MFAIATLLLLACLVPSASAQEGTYVVLYAPELNEFPKVTLYLDAYDAQGQFIRSLDLNSFTIYEDGLPKATNETSLLEPGLHTILALNLGATLSNRADTTVPTRFERAVFDLASWLNELDSEAPNQYSMVSNEGILVEKLQGKDDFTFQLQNYKPNLFNFSPSLASLNAAVSIAEKPNLISQSKQSILYITPLPLDEDLAGYTAIEARARAATTPIHVWLMAPETALNSPAAVALTRLASNTGGKFFFYMDESAAPNPEEYVGIFRSIYQLRFTSSINQSGSHTLRVQLTYGDNTYQSQEVPFDINLNLPTIEWVDIPATIERTFAGGGSARNLEPDVVTLQANVIFPDGYDRKLRATRLYVDGEVLAENTQEPFTFFGWPLEDFTVSGSYFVSVEAEDILGFRSISAPLPVRITVESQYPNWLANFFQFFNRGGWIAFAVVGLGAVVLVGRRINTMIQNGEASPRGLTFGEGMDPLLQEVPGISDAYETAQSAASNGRQTRAQENTEMQPVLIPMDARFPLPFQKIVVTEEPLTFGSDSAQVDVVLKHASIAEMHCLIQRSSSGYVTIADRGSAHGTWVNYTPVSSAGVVLNNGDLVAIGAITFRFELEARPKKQLRSIESETKPSANIP